MYQANERENPLHIELLSSPYPNGKFTNRRGRPTTENVIKFGPQPKSMIAQMLCNMKSKNHSTPRTSETIRTKDDQSVIEKSMTKVKKKKTLSNSDRSDDTTEHKQCLAANDCISLLAAHKKFSCDFPDCSYSCKLSSNLIKHKRTHTSERPYLCDRCSFRSNFINSLKAHQRVHTSERPYQCKYCDYKCISSSNLKKHCLRRHPSTC